MDLKKYIAELKRRNVFKAGIAYLVVAWLVAQIASIVLPTFDAPPYIMKTLLFILSLGFPLNLIFSWIYDLTPEGIKKTEAHPKSTEKSNLKSARLNKVIIASLSLVILLLLFNQLLNSSSTKNESIEGQNNKTDLVEKSIAVLPFLNLSEGNEQEYFSDGLSEEILNMLSNIPDLKVIARTSSFSFKGKNDDIRTIGQKLGVSQILEGSVLKVENKVRVYAKLIRVQDGSQVWSETYEREMDDIFKIQDEIAENVTNRLRVTLYSDLVNRYQPSQKAYDLYLKGRYFWNKRGRNLLVGLDYFKQAVNVDSMYSKAHAGIAESYVLIGRYNLASPHEIMPLCRKAAETAIRLDENCIEAQTALAYELMIYDWHWEKSEQMFKKAIEISPKYTPAHYLYGQFLNYIRNDFKSAKDQGLKAIELEPLNPICYFLYAMTLQAEQNYTEALKYYNMAIELDENSLSALYGKARTLNAMESQDEAINVLLLAINRVGRDQWLLTTLCESYVLAGEEKKALPIYEELKSRANNEYVSSLFLGRVAKSLTKYDEAKVYFKRAIIERSSELEVHVAREKELNEVVKTLMKIPN